MKKSPTQQAISTAGLINYQILSSKKALKEYPKLLRSSLQEAEKRFDAILEIPAPKANFDNIVLDYLENDNELDLLYSFLQNFNATDNSAITRKIIEDFQPLYTAYLNKISLSSAYYQLLQAISQNDPAFSPGQKRALQLLIRDMELAGVHLPAAKKARLAAINQALPQLAIRFSNQVLDSETQFFYRFTNSKHLQEMPAQDRNAAAKEAKKRRKAGWIFTLSMPSFNAIMKYCTDRAVRRQFFLAHCQVASNKPYDNRPLILKILKLRHEKAQLLGYRTYADYVLQERMLKQVKTVGSILKTAASESRKKGHADLQELKKFAKLHTLFYWDIPFYSEKLKKHKLQLDPKELQKYFPLEAVINGLFEIAQRLYGLNFQQISAPSYNRDNINFEVYEKKQLIAYFIFDLFARSGKQSGAWANLLRYRSEKGHKPQIPIVINVANFGKNHGPKPTLLNHLEVHTLFHEFGHALHVMLAATPYKNLSGFHTEWDFVELPSQIMENWTIEGASLDLFARHFENNTKIPDQLKNALKSSQTFMSGYSLLRQTEFGMLDFILHTMPPPKNIQKLQHLCFQIANKYSLIKKPPTYKMYSSFSHIFCGGYGAGYYSYLWSAILEADCFQKFQKNGILNKKIGRQFAATILKPGASESAHNMIKKFLGRSANHHALFKKLGLKK